MVLLGDEPANATACKHDASANQIAPCGRRFARFFRELPANGPIRLRIQATGFDKDGLALSWFGMKYACPFVWNHKR